MDTPASPTTDIVAAVDAARQHLAGALASARAAVEAIPQAEDPALAFLEISRTLRQLGVQLTDNAALAEHVAVALRAAAEGNPKVAPAMVEFFAERKGN